jgi:hypothetical protein
MRQCNEYRTEKEKNPKNPLFKKKKNNNEVRGTGSRLLCCNPGAAFPIHLAEVDPDPDL